VLGPFLSLKIALIQLLFVQFPKRLTKIVIKWLKHPFTVKLIRPNTLSLESAVTHFFNFPNWRTLATPIEGIRYEYSSKSGLETSGSATHSAQIIVNTPIGEVSVTEVNTYREFGYLDYDLAYSYSSDPDQLDGIHYKSGLVAFYQAPSGEIYFHQLNYVYICGGKTDKYKYHQGF
jgi:hypothetical protein